MSKVTVTSSIQPTQAARPVLFVDPRREQTRAERVAWEREWYARYRAQYDAAAPGTEERRDAFRNVCRHRRDLTRQSIFQRVEDHEPLAVFRYRWIYLALQFRGRLQAAHNSLQYRERDAAINRERLARGAGDNGRPYSKRTLQFYRRAVLSHEEYLVKAEAELTAFLSTARPPYHVWRRQEEQKKREEANERAAAREQEMERWNWSLAKARRALSKIHSSGSPWWHIVVMNLDYALGGEERAAAAAEPTITPEETLREAGIGSRRQTEYQRKMSTLLAGRPAAPAAEAR
jgi:hypothetical protein